MNGNVIGSGTEANTGGIGGQQRGRAAQVYPLEPEYVSPSFGQFVFLIEGRISRSQLWLRWALPVVAIHVVLWIMIAIAAAADSSGWTAAFFVLWIVFWLMTLWPNIAVLVKRIHDRNKTGWLVLAYWLPAGLQTILFIADVSDNMAASVIRLITAAVGIWFFIEFGCMRGTVGPNRYGPDPVPQP